MTTAAWKPVGEFSHFWFAALSEQLFLRYVLPHFVKRSGPINYIETGVAEAQSMLWALEHLGRPGGLFVGVDPFWPCRNWRPEDGEQHKTRAVNNLSLWYGHKPVDFSTGLLLWNQDEQDKAKPVCALPCEDSQTYLPKEHRVFDLAYCDACHDAPQALFDIIHLFRLLKVGGLLVIDDVERMYRGGRPQVGIALDAFLKTHHGYYDQVYANPKQVCYVKCNRRRRGQCPPTMESGPVIAPAGPTDGFTERDD